MKGIVFTEFIEMVENAYGIEVADNIIESSNLPSKGVYTSVGTYDHQEIVTLVIQLSKHTKVPVADLLRSFGKYLFGRFVTKYSAFFTHSYSTFQFLQLVEKYIHVEVRKLYPDAELPTFETMLIDDNHFEMIYRSERGMGDLAEGLILGCIEHFKENINIKKEDLSNGESKVVKFSLFKNA